MDHGRCRICGRESGGGDSVRVRGACRNVADRQWTVWSCTHCSALNALEPVDYDEIYKDYPIQLQKYDFFTRVILKNRLDVLLKAGLRPSHRILDFGCGKGTFVRFLTEKGYCCEGYDPYSEQFGDKAVLERKYDYILNQDVLEHLDDPRPLFTQLLNRLEPGGLLISGIPFSDHVDIHDEIDQIGVLHPPFHRWIISKRRAGMYFTEAGWTTRVLDGESCFDSWVPFVNSRFLYQVIKLHGGLMDPAFTDTGVLFILRHPSLLFWGFFGRLFAKKTHLVLITARGGH